MTRKRCSLFKSHTKCLASWVGGFLLLGQACHRRDSLISQRESQVLSLVGRGSSNQCGFSLLQRKSSKAKEKKQKRLEERAAMDAVCAKVDAANRVTLLFSSAYWNFSLLFNLTSFGATMWQNCDTTHPSSASYLLRESWEEVPAVGLVVQGGVDSSGSGCFSY